MDWNEGLSSTGFAHLSCGGGRAAGSADDHAHIACTLPRTLTMRKDVTPFQGREVEENRQMHGGCLLSARDLCRLAVKAKQ